VVIMVVINQKRGFGVILFNLVICKGFAMMIEV